MPTAEYAQLQYESGQTPVAMVALTDQGDHLEFLSADTLWSNRSGYVPVVRPDGVITGGVVTLAISGTNDLIDVAALTCYLAGVVTAVAASTDETCLRGVSTDICRINSVTVDSGGSIVIVSGTDNQIIQLICEVVKHKHSQTRLKVRRCYIPLVCLRS